MADSLAASTERILRDANVEGGAVFITMGVGKPSTVSEADLRRVDVELPSAFAGGAKAAGAAHCSLLTAVGADIAAQPSYFFRTSAGGGLYNHCKGTVEASVQRLGFASSAAFRPAALIGTPNTPAAVAWASKKLDSIVPAKYKSSHINTLAAGMVRHAEQQVSERAGADSGFQIFEGAELHSLYGSVPFPHGSNAQRSSSAEGEL